MGRLPGLEPGGIGRQIEGPADLGRRATGQDFYQGAGRAAFAGAVAQVGEATVQLAEHELESNVQRSLGEATRELNMLGERVAAEPDHNARQGLYESESQKILQRFREGIPSHRYRESFNFQIEPQTERGRMVTESGVRKSQLETTAANLGASAEAYMDAAKNEPDPVERERLYGLASSSVDQLAPIVGPMQAQAAKTRLEDRQQQDDLLYKAQAAADDIMARYPDDLAAQYKAANQFSGEMRALVMGNIESQQSQQAKAADNVSRQQFNILAVRAQSDMSDTELRDIAIRTGMEGRDYFTLMDAIAKRDSGGGYIGEWEHYFALKIMAKKNPEAFQQVELMRDYMNRISPGKLDKLIDLKAKGPPDGIFGSWEEEAMVIAVGLHPGDDMEAIQARSDFLETLQEDYDAESRRLNGAVLGSTARHQLIQFAIAKDTNPWYQADSQRRYEMRPERPQMSVEPSDDEFDDIMLRLEAMGELIGLSSDQVEARVNDQFARMQWVTYQQQQGIGVPQTAAAAPAAPQPEAVGGGSIPPEPTATVQPSAPVAAEASLVQSISEQIMLLESFRGLYLGTKKGERIEAKLAQLRAIRDGLPPTAAQNAISAVGRGVAAAPAALEGAARHASEGFESLLRALGRGLGSLRGAPDRGIEALGKWAQADRRRADAVLEELLK